MGVYCTCDPCSDTKLGHRDPNQVMLISIAHYSFSCNLHTLHIFRLGYCVPRAWCLLYKYNSLCTIHGNNHIFGYQQIEYRISLEELDGTNL